MTAFTSLTACSPVVVTGTAEPTRVIPAFGYVTDCANVPSALPDACSS